MAKQVRITERPKELIHPPSPGVLIWDQQETLSLTPSVRRLESQGLLDMKLKMRRHEHIRQVVNVYWELMPKNSKGRVNVTNYQALGLSIFKLISRDERDLQNRKLIQDAWANYDSKDLDYSQFYDKLMTFCDIWGPEFDSYQYAEFLTKILDRITMRKKISMSGSDVSTEVILPTIKIVFPTKRAPAEESEELKWIDVNSEESMESMYEYDFVENEETKEKKKVKRLKDVLKKEDIEMPTGFDEDDKEMTIVYDELADFGDSNCLYELQMAALDDIVPFGFPSEYYLSQLKLGNKLGDDESRPSQVKVSTDQLVVNEEPVSNVREARRQSKQIVSEVIKKASSPTKSAEELARTPVERLSDIPEEFKGKKVEDFGISKFPNLKFYAGVTRERHDQLQSQIAKVYDLKLKKATSVVKLQEENDFAIKHLPTKEVPTYDRQVTLKERSADSQIKKGGTDSVPLTGSSKTSLAATMNDPGTIDHTLDEKQTLIQNIMKAMVQQKFLSIHRKLEKEARRPNPVKVAKKVEVESREPLTAPPCLERTKYALFPELISQESIRMDTIIEEETIIETANEDSLSLVLYGKPRCGKTAIAAEVCKALDLIHIEPAIILNEIFDKAKKGEDDEEDEPAYGDDESQQQEKPPIWNEFEQSIVDCLQEGKELTTEQLVELINFKMEQDVVHNKGFILDLPDNIELLRALLVRKEINLKKAFSYAIYVDVPDVDVTHLAASIKQDSVSKATYSAWDVYEATKPLVREVEDSDAEQDEEEDDRPKIDESILIKRAEDGAQITSKLGEYHKDHFPIIAKFMSEFPFSLIIDINASGLRPFQVKDIILAHLDTKSIPRPLALKLEEEGEFKGLLTQEIEEEKEPRKWSLWKTVDPVALQDGKVLIGKPEFGCEYNGNVFVFDSEETQKRFLAYPRRYLNSPPKMPKQFRLGVIGPRRSGKKTQAKLLSEKYGWPIINISDILTKVANMQKEWEEHIPSNPESGNVHITGPNFEEFMNGGCINGALLTSVILYNMGIPMMKKPPPPPEPVSGEEEQVEEPPEEVVEEEATPPEPKVPSKPNTASMKSEKIDEEEGDDDEKEEGEEEDDEPEPIVYDDLALDDVVVEVGEDGKPAKIEGFIMVGYPLNEEQANALKDQHLEFDKIIAMVDPEEGETLRKRGIEDVALLDTDMEQAGAALGVAKDVFGDDNVIEIECHEDITTVHHRICAGIDPLFTQVDDETISRTRADCPDEGLQLPWGPIANFDPVIYKEQNWLFPGNPEIEMGVGEKLYNFASEIEQEKFKLNPEGFIPRTIANVIPPHILIAGIRGSGVATFLCLLEGKYGMSSIELKSKFLEILDRERKSRRHVRFLMKGYQQPEPKTLEDVLEQEEKEREEGYEHVVVDPEDEDEEIQEEAEDFEKDKHECEIVRSLLDGLKGYFINANWFDVEEDKVAQKMPDLLQNARRMPDFAIFLTSDEDTIKKRLLDEAKIKAEYERLAEARRKELADAKEQARLEKIEAGEIDEEDEEEEEEQEEEEEEEDPDAPNLQAMLDEETNRILERRNEDLALIEEFKDRFDELNIETALVDTSGPKAKVYTNILYEVSPYIDHRQNHLEKNLIAKLSASQAQDIVGKSASLSIYKYTSPLTPGVLPEVRDFPVLYRNHVYFMKDEKERDAFIKTPLKYTQRVDSAPWDLKPMPHCAIIGPPRSGKSDLANSLQSQFGLIPIHLRATLEELVNIESVLGQKVKEALLSGKEISSALAVDAVAYASEKAECVEKGFVIVDFPHTLQEAQMLAEKGINPHPLFITTLPLEEVVKRSKPGPGFDNDDRVLLKRIQLKRQHHQDLNGWYSNTFHNVKYLDAEKSKWYINDTAKEAINRIQKATYDYSIASIKNNAVDISDLCISRYDINKKLSELKSYCPVVWKQRGELHNVTNFDHVAEYYGMTYKMSSPKALQMFLDDPDNFLIGQALPEYLPKALSSAEASEIPDQQIVLQGYCPVALKEKSELIKGNVMVLVAYKNKVYTCYDGQSRGRFMRKPQHYSEVILTKEMLPKEPHRVKHPEEYENDIEYLEDYLGEAVYKAMLDLGDNRLCYPTLSLRETALKYFAIYLKASNPKNTPYLNAKYARMMAAFKADCKLPEIIFREGTRKLMLEDAEGWFDWDDDFYFSKVDEYDSLLENIENNDNHFFKFIR